MNMLFKVLFLALIICMKYILGSPTVSANVREYDRKTCTNEPTCDLIATDPYIRNTRSSINKRNCMCDAACVEYRDCCSDSPYYKAEEQSRLQVYFCPPLIKVYLKASCPQSWTGETTRSLCQKSLASENSNDTYLHIPVTDATTNITYANKYCAACHEVADYIPWTGKPACGEIRDVFLSAEGSVRTDIKLRIDYTKYASKAHTIWQFVEFDSKSGQFVSHYDKNVFICRLSANLPNELRFRVRTCVPNVKETCETNTDSELQKKCKNQTALVYLKKNSKKVYRNLECAKCNGVSSSDLTGCPVTIKA